MTGDTYGEVEAVFTENYIDVIVTTSNVSTLFLCHLQTDNRTGSAENNRHFQYLIEIDFT